MIWEHIEPSYSVHLDAWYRDKPVTKSLASPTVAMSASVTLILVSSVLASLAAEEACRPGTWRCADNTCIPQEKVGTEFKYKHPWHFIQRFVIGNLTVLTRVTRTRRVCAGWTATTSAPTSCSPAAPCRAPASPRLSMWWTRIKTPNNVLFAEINQQQGLRLHWKDRWKSWGRVDTANKAEEGKERGKGKRREGGRGVWMVKLVEHGRSHFGCSTLHKDFVCLPLQRWVGNLHQKSHAMPTARRNLVLVHFAFAL